MGFKSKRKKERLELMRNIRLWHYTTDLHFKKISEAGVIGLTNIGIEENEKPAVWFSKDPNWENTVMKKLKVGEEETDPLFRDGLFQYGVIPIRIEIDCYKVDLVDWRTYKKISGISLEHANKLEYVARGVNASPSDWYASFHSIPAYMWKSVGFWNGTIWTDHDLGGNDEDRGSE